MKVHATFRPSLIASGIGAWHKLSGDWDGSVLWFIAPDGAFKGKEFGVHLGSNTVFERAEGPTQHVPRMEEAVRAGADGPYDAVHDQFNDMASIKRAVGRSKKTEAA